MIAQDRPLRVLAVDDSRTIRDLMSLALSRAGIGVELASNGQEGLDRLNAMDTPPDVIVTDINMPVLDGFGMLSALRSSEATRKTPVLVLTTEEARDMKMRAREAGASGWIVKPFDPPRLVMAIRTVAAR